MSLSKYHIYGERSSGTNFLNVSLALNFEAVDPIFEAVDPIHGAVDVTDEKFKKYGAKHWFGNFLDLKDTDDTLFICIVRDPIKWLKSLYNKPRFIDLRMVENQEFFLTNEVISGGYFYSKTIPPNDNMIRLECDPCTGKFYNNIFELRYKKLKWMCEDLPKLVKNYILIRYEDLINDFHGIMNKIKDKGLKKKNIIEKDMEMMKNWMKRSGYENVEETAFEFIQPDPHKRLDPWCCNETHKPFNFSINDYPKEFIYYEKLLGYYN